MIDEKTIMGIVGVIILMGVAMFMVVTISD
jgi:hypothetical protein